MSDFPAGVIPVPINGRVLVRILGGEKKTSGGIIIPDTTTERPICGRVEEVSEGYYDDGVFRTHTVQIGDTVVFQWKAGIDLYLGDTINEQIEYRLVHEKEIFCILKGVCYG